MTLGQSDRRRWTVAIWLPHDPIPAPRWEEFDRLEDAVQRAWSASLSVSATWAKVYRTGDERDVRAFWDREGGWSELSRTAAATLETLRRGEAANREAQAPLPASVSATPEGSQRGRSESDA